MKKRLKRLLSNKGMSLVELVVAMFLTTVIMAIAFGLFVPVTNLMNTMKSNAHMDTVSATVDEYLRGTLQTATSLKFVVLGDDNSIDEDADGESIKGFLNSNVKVLAILDAGEGETACRVFDFGNIEIDEEFFMSEFPLYETLKKRLEEKDEAEYGVFNEPFYENTSCAVEFYKADGNRLQVASQCQRDTGKKDKDGKPVMDLVNQKHVLSFKLLNSKMTSFRGIVGEEGYGYYTNVNPEEQTSIEGHCYLILYTVP